MKKANKPNTVDVYLEPDVIEMLSHVAKAEGLTREQVLNSLLDNARADAEAKR